MPLRLLWFGEATVIAVGKVFLAGVSPAGFYALHSLAHALPEMEVRRSCQPADVYHVPGKAYRYRLVGSRFSMSSAFSYKLF